MPKNKKLKYDLRREEFLAAAYRTIKKKGLAGLTVRAVAQEAGFTAGALVHYVKSIDQLLLDAEEYSGRGWRAGMEEAERQPDKLQALREVIFFALPSDDSRRGHWNYWVGFWERSIRNARVRKRMQMRYAEWFGRLEHLIKNAQKSGDIDMSIDVKEAARVCVALLDGIGTQTLRSGFPLSPKTQRTIIDKWIINWLKPTRPLTSAVRVPVLSLRDGSPAPRARAKAKHVSIPAAPEHSAETSLQKSSALHEEHVSSLRDAW
jgi:AcrR family transcriptional regulator